MSEATFDPDIFAPNGPDGFKICLSGFGRNLVADMEDYIVAPAEGDDDYDPDFNPLDKLRWGIGELVKICQHLNSTAPELYAACKNLTGKCVEDFGDGRGYGDGDPGWADDETVCDPKTALTFGDIRRAQAALTKAEAQQ